MKTPHTIASNRTSVPRMASASNGWSLSNSLQCCARPTMPVTINSPAITVTEIGRFLVSFVLLISPGNGRRPPRTRALANQQPADDHGRCHRHCNPGDIAGHRADRLHLPGDDVTE